MNDEQEVFYMGGKGLMTMTIEDSRENVGELMNMLSI